MPDLAHITAFLGAFAGAVAAVDSIIKTLWRKRADKGGDGKSPTA